MEINTIEQQSILATVAQARAQTNPFGKKRDVSPARMIQLAISNGFQELKVLPMESNDGSIIVCIKQDGNNLYYKCLGGQMPQPIGGALVKLLGLEAKRMVSNG